MTTIDGHTIYINDPEIESIQNTVSIPIAGTDFSHIDHLGYDGLVITLNGHESTREAYNLTMSYLMSEDEMTLILDTGYSYKVHNVNKTYVRANESIGNYPYSVTMITHDPYAYGASTTTRSKTITTADQEWSQDDSANDISTAGNVDAKPDIEITAGSAGDYEREGPIQEKLDPTDIEDGSTSFVLRATHTFDAIANTVLNLQQVSILASQDGEFQVRYSINGAAEVTLVTWTESGGSQVPKSYTSDVSTGVNEYITINYYMRKISGVNVPNIKDSYAKVQEFKRAIITDIKISNIADEGTVTEVANLIFPDMVTRINADGSGHIDYLDDFTDEKYLDALYTSEGITHDAINDELDIADDGYIEFKFDVKYPMSGVPSLTSTVNITSGAPTIQVANDAAGVPGTWYDIDTAIVDNVSTEYRLKSGSDVVFDGETVLWFRFDCVKTAAATCSIIEFDLDVDIITIDALIPIINKGGSANTFKCVQSSDSSVNCTVDLIYNDRWWA